MKKEVLVFISDGYADWEGAYICAELHQPHTAYVVKTVGLDKKPKVSMGGLTVAPDYDITDYPAEFAMLLLVGGLAWLEQKNNAILPLVQHAAQKGIPVAAICAATNFLAENGFLDTVKHTGNSLEFMQAHAPHYKGGALFVEKQAVSDGAVLTANGSAALEFAREIMLELKVTPQLPGAPAAGNPAEIIKQWYNFHKLGFYRE